MATLQQTLRGLPQADNQLTRGPGGVLQRAQTLQDATKAAGLAAAPTTPMGAQMAGAGAQAAKMAGTPQQMQAALQQSTEAPTLETALRQKQYGRQATTAEAASLAKSTDMQKLGGLGDRVTNFVNARKASIYGIDQAAAAGQETAVGTVRTEAKFDNKPIAPIADKLEELRNKDQVADPTGYNQLMADINTYFGRTVNNPITATELATLYQSSSDILGKLKAGIKEPTVTDLVADPQFGYSIQQLSSLLGIPADKIGTYTATQLSDAVNQIASAEYTKAKQLEQQAGSTLVGAAERGLAREAGRELSAVGVRASEADMQRLSDSVESAETVTINGQAMSIGQALSDENISQLIKQYVDSPAGSAFRKQLDQNEPQLSQYINTHLNALTAAASKMETGVTQFGTIQSGNVKIFTDVGLTPDVGNLLSPGAGGFQTTALDATKIPTIGYLSGLPKEQKDAAANIIKGLATTNPQMVTDIGKLTPAQLTTLGIGKPNSNWDKMNNYNANVDTLNSIPADNYDALIAQTFSDVSSLSLAQDLVSTGNKLRTLGLDPGTSVSSLNPDTLKQDLLSGVSKVSLQNAAEGNVPAFTKKKLGSPQVPAGIEGDLVSKLGSLLEDGNLTAEEMNAPGGPVRSLNLDELVKLEDLSRNGKSQIDQPTITRLRSVAAEKNTRDTYNATKGEFGLNAALDMANSDPSGRKVDKSLLSHLLEPELLNYIATSVDFYRKYKNTKEYDRVYKGYVDVRNQQLERAIKAGIASPAIYKIYYELRGGPVSFSM